MSAVSHLCASSNILARCFGRPRACQPALPGWLLRSALSRRRRRQALVASRAASRRIPPKKRWRPCRPAGRSGEAWRGDAAFGLQAVPAAGFHDSVGERHEECCKRSKSNRLCCPELPWHRARDAPAKRAAAEARSKAKHPCGLTQGSAARHYSGSRGFPLQTRNDARDIALERDLRESTTSRS